VYLTGWEQGVCKRMGGQGVFNRAGTVCVTGGGGGQSVGM
jgi:hypothetical protein